jgi:alkyl hydroperoxide reductase subunit F
MEEVKVYTTPTCPYCTIAKEYLSKRGISFKAYDVTEDSEALSEMLRVTNGARSVPVITACGEVLVGFNAERLDQMLDCIKNRSELPEETDPRYKS